MTAAGINKGMNADLAAQLEQSEIHYMADRMRAIQERSGNPMGVHIRQVDGLLALRSSGMPWPQFNTVKGLESRHVEQLDDILGFYPEDGRAPQLEIIPSKGSPELSRALAARGYVQTGFHASWYMEGINQTDAAGQRLPTGIEVRELEGDEFDTYARIHCLGTGLPIAGLSHVADNNIVLHGRKGWSFYLALADGIPAGTGVMYAQRDQASLTFAATLPEYRGRGIQQALIRHRLAAAAALGCTLQVSQTAYGSISGRNMERCGMRLGYTRVTWTKED
ncbi:GNAT family N-acetyltransferase [Paenibacillus sp. JX-17]|uniref:GNAT family N-acetyltransferase n=1 Tax=Paenibacillus lacisoli TaxID=3064525 RepID=A0ABT9CDV2_9BACL|nr:GNAT family N-acetyltransferase [Paenibacillus sp. JX-17]MDO7907458.1 GNAT family N-acetyltransferase [Paenibacillus sp. JX-17]